MRERKRRVSLVMQNAWDSDVLTMPLALGYLKAYADADPAVQSEVEIRIHNFRRCASVSQMASELFRDPPDVVGFSVLGWNYNNFGRLSETFKQVNPSGWCVFGGNHVSHQAERAFRLYPSVDLVVNGEGEVTFCEILKAYLAGKKPEDCGDILGLSYRVDRNVVSTADRPRLRDLDLLPSPLLTGAIPMQDATGRFLYDVALMETNRGCPYSCSFCYWGGAIGQKIHSFSRDRLREELRYLGRHRVEHLALCDSNFGMLAADAEFVEDMISTREQLGYPRDFLTSWAKNKSKVFFSIVKRLQETGFQSSFTLSLQTLSPDALEHMQRKNMKINDFEDICRWLADEGLDTDVELIWGAPGETCESFLAGYDRIAKLVPRIATYPMLLLPNTEYDRSKQKHRMVTVREAATDFEVVLSHASISLDENRRMHAFLFWARLLAEHQVLRLVFFVAQRLTSITQSELLLSVDRWFSASRSPAAEGLRALLHDVVDSYDITRITNAVAYTYLHEGELGPVFESWWRECVVSRAASDCQAFLEDVMHYDWASRPVHDDVGRALQLRQEQIDGELFWVRTVSGLRYDIRAQATQLRRGQPPVLKRGPQELTLYYRIGFSSVVANHEFVTRFAGRTREELEEEAELARAGRFTKSVQMHSVGVRVAESTTRRLPVAP
jgi:radical SAM C-methyltransferase